MDNGASSGMKQHTDQHISSLGYQKMFV